MGNSTLCNVSWYLSWRDDKKISWISVHWCGGELFYVSNLCVVSIFNTYTCVNINNKN